MTDDLDGRRAELEKRLAEKREKTAAEVKRAAGGDQTGMGRAVKLSSEFIAGVVVGAGLGWGIDRLAGTAPFGMIVFLLLGFLAGVLNVMRATGAVSPPRVDRDKNQ
jgi:ATP synthase protein I